MLKVVLLRFEQSGGVLVDGDRVNFVTLGDFIHHVLPYDDFAEHRMFAIEVRRRKVGDEELAAVGVRPRVGHGEDATLRVLERAVDLVSKLVAGTAGPGASWVAALNHEIGNHTVEGNAIVVSTLREVEKIGGGHWDLRGEEPCIDVASGGVECDFDVRHGVGNTGLTDLATHAFANTQPYSPAICCSTGLWRSYGRTPHV